MLKHEQSIMESFQTTNNHLKSFSNRAKSPNLSKNFNTTTEINDFGYSSVCVVCGDKAIGRHYGAVSCNGCKGFFRRSVWQNLQYTCRFNKNCTIDRKGRNACRFCRFAKCIADGMKPEAIQNERDRIGSTKRLNRKRSNGPSPFTYSLTRNATEHIINTRKILENCAKKKLKTTGSNSVTEESNEVEQHFISECMLAKNSNDERNVFKTQTIPETIPLNFEEENSFQELIKTLLEIDNQLELKDLITASTSYDTRQHVVKNLLEWATNELLEPIRRLNLEQTELVCLKAIILLYSDINGLSNGTKEIVQNSRDHIYKALFFHQTTLEGCTLAAGAVRFAGALEVLLALKSISNEIQNNPTMSLLFGLVDSIAVNNEICNFTTSNNLKSDNFAKFYSMEEKNIESTYSCLTNFNLYTPTELINKTQSTNCNSISNISLEVSKTMDLKNTELLFYQAQQQQDIKFQSDTNTINAPVDLNLFKDTSHMLNSPLTKYILMSHPLNNMFFKESLNSIYGLPNVSIPTLINNSTNNTDSARSFYAEENQNKVTICLSF